MKVTLNWLKQYVDFNWSPEELRERLPLIGIEVASAGVIWVRPCGVTRWGTEGPVSVAEQDAHTSHGVIGNGHVGLTVLIEIGDRYAVGSEGHVH